MPMFPSYRNESTDLYCKSIDWFLYVGNTGMKKAKKCSAIVSIFYQIHVIVSLYWVLFGIMINSTKYV